MVRLYVKHPSDTVKKLEKINTKIKEEKNLHPEYVNIQVHNCIFDKTLISGSFPGPFTLI